jgi:hypothetical protein
LPASWWSTWTLPASSRRRLLLEAVPCKGEHHKHRNEQNYRASNRTTEQSNK